LGTALLATPGIPHDALSAYLGRLGQGEIVDVFVFLQELVINTTIYYLKKSM